MKWAIDDSRIDQKKFRSMPKSVKVKWRAWTKIVINRGPDALLRYPSLHDEGLAGEWKGYRSSRLSRDYRVIYRRRDDVLVVDIVRISKHDYKRRR